MGTTAITSESAQNSTRPFVSRQNDARQGASVDQGVATAEALHPLMSPEQNVDRIMKTGSVWFGVAVGASAIFMGFLLSAGWRPSSLPVGAGALFWIGAVVVVLSIGLIGWSGCPILEVSVPVADRNKTRTMQFGTAMFILGSAATVFAVLLGPAV